MTFLRFLPRPTPLLVLLAALMAAPGMVAAQARSLQESIEKAVLTHPEVKARFHDFQSTLHGQAVTRAGLLPEVTVQGWTGREWRAGTADQRAADWSRHGYIVELRQLLFDGFSTLNTVKQEGFEKLSAYYELLATVDSLAMEAAYAHLDVVRYRRMEGLARDNFDVHQTILEQLRERQASGVGRGVDLEQANGRLALAQTNLMTETGNLNDVSQRYRRLMGEAPAAILLDAPDVAHLLPEAPTDFVASVRRNPSLLSKQALVQAAGLGVSAARGRHSPTLELRASTGKDRAQPGTPYRDAQSSNVQLVLSYNLFRGGADQARIRQTKAQSYAAVDVRDYTCRNVQQELAVAWNNIMKLRQQIPYLREHELATSKVRTAYAQQFQIGERSLLDLLDTENELFDSRRALVNAEFDLKKEELRWLSLSHRILEAVALAQPFEDSPEEARSLGLPDELLQICTNEAPDTSNLKPVVVQYQDDLLPPRIHPLNG
ncbi:MAG TPA: TolC family outer membrane protein [Burkholderiaceae bacterium]|nr:TolC family outer membrane protein [Burkholderiaceae bacterium]